MPSVQISFLLHVDLRAGDHHYVESCWFRGLLTSEITPFLRHIFVFFPDVRCRNTQRKIGGINIPRKLDPFLGYTWSVLMAKVERIGGSSSVYNGQRCWRQGHRMVARQGASL